VLEAEIWGMADASDGSMIFIRPLDQEIAVPIFIGRAEAQAIIAGFSETGLPRPLTVDLMMSFVRHTGYVLNRAEISSLRDNTFYARAIFSRTAAGESGGDEGKTELVLDARPSDVLALAVRSKSPLYIAREVLNEAGIPTGDLTPGQSGGERRLLLQAELDEAVEAEDYERAARLRDMILLLDQEQDT
jgi:bifunctional DNase/RNase